MSDERVVYEINEVVWAKIRGYPWWPAYVSGVIKNTGQPGQVEYIVNFYGDTSQQPVDNRIDSARLAPDKIAKFQSNYAEFEQKARSSKRLAKSVLIAEEALKSQGFNIVFEKRPSRRPSKAHSKLSSDMQSSDHMESELADSQNRSSSKALKSSPVKKETAPRKESPKVKPQPVEIEPPITVSPSKKQPTPVKEQPKQNVVPSGLPTIKESKLEKHQEKEPNEPKERQQKTREARQTRQTKAPKETKDAKQKSSGNRNKQTTSEDDEQQESPQLKKQPLSTPISRKSKPKVKRSASKPPEKKEQEPNAIKQEPQPPVKAPEPASELLVITDKLKSLLGSPFDLIAYLSTVDINVSNVKQILDCQIVDILHDTKDPTAKELLKTLKAMLIARYFDDEVADRVKTKTFPNETALSRSDPNKDLRAKTKSKAQGLLRKNYGVSEQQSVSVATHLQQYLHQRDPTGGAAYRRFALQALSQLKNRTLSREETLRRIATNTLAK